MASACKSDEEKSSEGESDASDEIDSADYSDLEAVEHQGEPCKYYNGRGCRDGSRCSYLHVCKYALRGKCRNGSKCKLIHSTGGASNRAPARGPDEEQRKAPVLTDGRFYQWQLNDGNSWMDVDNDHVIEAQYSLPHTKSMTIHNTAYGSLSLDFNRMRIYKKSLSLRRLDDGNTEWVWYCTLRRKWIKYGDKDSKGKEGPVRNSDIEKQFQSDPRSPFTFIVDSENLEIRFRDMCQVGKTRKRKVTRRPVYRQKQTGAGVSPASLQNLHPDSKPQWEFEGDRGVWYVFKHRSGSPTECSITSADIEGSYQKDRCGRMAFKVKGQTYKLDFAAMSQTNLQSQNTRRIRRVLV